MTSNSERPPPINSTFSNLSNYGSSASCERSFPPPPCSTLGKTLVSVNHDCESFESKKVKKMDSTSGSQASSVESGAALIPEKSRTSFLQAIMHLLKSYMGTGILAMPHAFSNAGLWLGVALAPIICFCCSFPIHLLIQSTERLSNAFGLQSLDYETIAEEALKIGPRPLRRFSRGFGNLVKLFIIACQYNICCIYALFAADTLKQILEQFTDIRIPIQLYLLALFVPQLLLNCLGNIKKLSILSTAGNLVQAIGVIIICCDLFTGLPSVTERPAVVNDFTKIPLFVSTAIFAFEGMTVVVPIHKSMKRPGQFLAKCGVVNIVMSGLTSLYIVMGFFGYLKYGDSVGGSITKNLPPLPQFQVVLIFFCLSLFFTYPLQMYVLREMFEPYIEQRFEKRAKFYNRLATAILIAITFISAGVIPKLDLLFELAGSVTSSSIAIIFPPLIHLFVFWEDVQGPSRWWLAIRNCAITGFGILGFVLGTYFSLKNIIEEFVKDPS